MKKLKIILQHKLFYVVLIFITISNCIYFTQIKKYKSVYKSSNLKIVGKVIDITQKEDSSSFIVYGREKILCNYYDHVEISYGDIVVVNGSFKTLKNSIPGQFDYKRYLYNNKIYNLMDVKKVEVIKKNSNVLYGVKNYLFDRVSSNNKVNSYIKTLILGKNEIESDYRLIYQNLGLSHLFSISGMHIGILIGIVMFILKKIKCNSFLEFLLIAMFVFLYMFITNYQASVLRSGLFLVINKINKLLKFDIVSFKVLLITLCLIIIFNPFIIYNIGFIFSGCISLFLIYFKNLITGNYITKSFKLSFLVFLCSFPIVIYFFYQVNLLSFFYNIFYIPFVSFVILPFCIICFIFPNFSNVFLLFIHILENISLFLNRLDTIIVIGHCNMFLVICYYTLLVFVLEKLKKGKYKYVILIIIIIFLFCNCDSIFNRNLFLMLDVGQGDSFLLKVDNKIVLIDTGGVVNKKYENSNILLNVLKYYGINKIDSLVLSHGDYDHMGNSINLVNNIKIENVIFNNDDFNELETELIKVLEKKNIKYYKGLKELNVGNDKLYFLNTYNHGNENDNSNVIYFKLNNYKFLFMGDAGIEREKDILQKYNLTDIDFIKIGHHGSNTSSSKSFIDSIKPKNCLISVGKNNRYGHPKESVLDILDDYCDIYRTDINGSIEIKINKNNYKIKTYSPQKGKIYEK